MPFDCLPFLPQRRIRQWAEERGVVPLFHYTATSVVDLMIKNGLRMSTQGQGDGGVYFSVLGPASYKIGTRNYEENISERAMRCLCAF